MIARVVSGRLGQKYIHAVKALAQVAHTLVATDFAKKGKRGKKANGKKGARGTIGIIGHRFRGYLEQMWGPYAAKPGCAKEHRALFKAAQLVTAAMADADAPYNKAEQEELRGLVRRLRRNRGMPKDVRQLLDPRYIVGTIGRDAGNPQHTDPQDFGGGLFTKIGEGPCMFALPEFQVYVQANDGDVLYINTPVVLHGACVPPAAASAKRAGQMWTACNYSAARKEHLTYGVFTHKE